MRDAAILSPPVENAIAEHDLISFALALQAAV
jgi:hypothetical protein